MTEVPRPVTKAFWIHEEYKLKTAAERIIEFHENGKPIELWHDWCRDDTSSRNIDLTVSERNLAMMQIFEMCGLRQETFHQHIRMFRRDTGLDDEFWANESTFAKHKPTPWEIFQWLGDFGLFTRDDANDFDVGFALDSPEGLVVVKYHSEEPFIDDDTLETGYQIALYPPDKIHDIFWYTGKYDSRA